MDRGTLALTLSTVGLIPGIFSMSLPPLAEVHAKRDDGGHILAAEATAIGLSAGFVVAVSVGTRTPAVAGVGLLSVGLFAYAFAHARQAGA